MNARHNGTLALLATVALGACTHQPFERYIAQRRWADADTAFRADSALLNDDRALLQAGKLYSSPTSGVYDLSRARTLLRRLITRSPGSKYSAEATERLALVESMLRQRDSAAAAITSLEQRVAQLTSETRRLRMSLDSSIARSDSLQRGLTRMEADLREREEQLRALRLELARLKEIDLNPRLPARPPQRDER